MGYYCVAQSGYVIFGVGKTQIGALRDANQWLSPGERVTLKEIDVPAANRVHGGMYLYQCTKAVYDSVKQHGGDIRYEESKTWIRMPGEVEAKRAKGTRAKADASRMLKGAKYIQISAGRRARVQNGTLYVEQTNMGYGMLESGGYAGRVYKMPYRGTLKDALKENRHGISDIDRCIEEGVIARKGRLIR